MAKSQPPWSKKMKKKEGFETYDNSFEDELARHGAAAGGRYHSSVQLSWDRRQ